jgi:hypothetical protein
VQVDPRLFKIIEPVLALLHTVLYGMVENARHNADRCGRVWWTGVLVDPRLFKIIEPVLAGVVVDPKVLKIIEPVLQECRWMRRCSRSSNRSWA